MADNTTFWERRRRARVRWEHVNDTAAVAYETLPHPHKPRVRAWISVADPDDLHRCMMGVERALDYGKVHLGDEDGVDL